MQLLQTHQITPWDIEYLQSPKARQNAAGLGFYALAGVADPKAPFVDVPIIAAATGLGYWTAYARQLPYAMAGSIAIGLIIDPAHKFDNWGVDEIQPYSYGSNFVDNPWEIDSRGF